MSEPLTEAEYRKWLADNGLAPSRRGADPYPGTNFDPMTPTQRENSRRMVADARFHRAYEQLPTREQVGQFAFDNTIGIPRQFGIDVAKSIDHQLGKINDPEALTRAISGAGRTAGLALMGAGKPLAGLAVDQAGSMITPAAASPLSMVPIPEPNPYRVTAPQQQQQAEQPTSLGILFDNIKAAGQGVYDTASRLGSEVRGILSGGEFRRQSYEDWLKENGQSTMARIKDLESTGNVRDAGLRGGNAIRQQKAKLARELEAGLRRQYEADMKRQEDEHKARFDLPFAQRNRALSGAMTFGPAILAGGMMGRSLVRHRNKIKQLTDEIKAAGPAASQAKKDELLELLARDPQTVLQNVRYAAPYIGNAAGGALAGKAVEDYVDFNMLPQGSAARDRVRSLMPPINDDGSLDPRAARELATSYLTRGLSAGLAMPVGFFSAGGRLPDRARVAAEQASGLQPVNAMRMRQRNDREALRIGDDRELADSTSRMDRADTKALEDAHLTQLQIDTYPLTLVNKELARIRKEMREAGILGKPTKTKVKKNQTDEESPSLPPPEAQQPGGPPASSGPTPPAGQGATGGGQGASDMPSSRQRPPKAPKGRGQGTSQEQFATFDRSVKREVLEAFMQRKGKISSEQVVKMFPKVEPATLKRFLDRLKKANESVDGNSRALMSLFDKGILMGAGVIGLGAMEEPRGILD